MDISIEINSNIYDINLDNLMTIGNRVNNSKRNFLFISKVLGKHIEVKPDICKVIGFVLASLVYGRNEHTSTLIQYIENQEVSMQMVREAMSYTFKAKNKVCVLGFAETATGLGMAVASAIDNCNYITTTREDIKSIKSLLNFEEEHSHATTHKCFPLDADIIYEAEEIILVDDEITTGKSMINIINELSKVTKIKKYVVLTILDWRNDQHKKMYADFERENGISIEVLYLISGQVSFSDMTSYTDKDENIITEKNSVIDLPTLERISVKKENGQVDYYRDSGRFGVNHNNIVMLEAKCEEIAEKINQIIGEDKKILVLGHGENIYIPSRVASKIKGDVFYKSTTRSPIYCNKNNKEYPINQKDIFYDEGVKYYFYNRDSIEERFDKVILITENDLNIKLTSNMMIVKI